MAKLRSGESFGPSGLYHASSGKRLFILFIQFRWQIAKTRATCKRRICRLLFIMQSTLCFSDAIYQIETVFLAQLHLANSRSGPYLELRATQCMVPYPCAHFPPTGVRSLKRGSTKRGRLFAD